jgi:hypothetical protein
VLPWDDGDDVAGEVHQADATNLPLNECDRAGEGRGAMPSPPCQVVSWRRHGNVLRRNGRRSLSLSPNRSKAASLSSGRWLKRSDAAIHRSRLTQSVRQGGETMHGSSGLVARIKQIRRADTRRAADSSGKAPRTTAPQNDTTALEVLQTRVEHLEQLVEGLQDSIHRESERQGGRITEFETRMEPAAISVALSKDARDRGL